MHIDAKEGQANFVTDYDRQVQEILRKSLAEIVPDAVFIGEEGEQEACAIASGRAELYFELILSPWDYAAGSLSAVAMRRFRVTLIYSLISKW